MNVIFREGREGITKIGLISEYDIKSILNRNELQLVPFGTQDITNIKVDIVMPDKTSPYYAITLYKQRNGRYKLKLKETLVNQIKI